MRNFLLCYLYPFSVANTRDIYELYEVFIFLAVWTYFQVFNTVLVKQFSFYGILCCQSVSNDQNSIFNFNKFQLVF